MPPRVLYLATVRALRSYRLVPAVLALSLVLTAATPLVRHSCGMTETEMAAKPCCKNKAGHHGAPAMHGDMAHGAANDAMPCHDAPAPSERSAPCPDDGATMHDACCFTADAPIAPTTERLQLSPTALVVLAASFALPTLPPAEAHGPPPSGSPPPAPTALHVLYGSFLT